MRHEKLSIGSRVIFGGVLGLAMLAGSQMARAAEPDPPSLLGTDLAEPCAWPTVVRVGFGQGMFGTVCGGTLIHPELIAVYAECVTASYTLTDVILGDDVDVVPLQEVEPISKFVDEACLVHPADKVAVCRLAEPVDLPINPIVYGCESGIIEVGREVAMASFGLAEYPPNGEHGIKRWGTSQLSIVGTEGVIVPETGPIGCGPRDLGSPLYTRFPDGSWHLIGIGSDTEDCAGTTTYTRLDSVAPWIEDVFGIDVTPCHDIDGTWNPGPDCTNVSMVGPEGVGTWADWCEGTPTLVSETCGPGFGAEATAPIVTIEAPLDQTSFASGEEFALEVAVNHPVSGVRIEINDQLQAAVDSTWPYGFSPVQLPDGVYSLVAVAEGEDGETRESTPVTILIGQDSADTGTDTGTDMGTDTGSGEDEVGADSGVSPTDACACRIDSEAAPAPAQLGASGLALLALLGLRRRRE